MSYNINDLFVARNSRSGYEIEQSLRFESNAYLSRSPGSSGNRNVWTLSLWAKRGNLGSTAGSQQDMYSAGTGGTDILYWTSSDQIAVDAPALSVLVSNDRFRDPSAWYHIVMAVDATNGTNSNRTRIYVNNREITSWATDGRGSLTSNKYLTNSTERHTLGIRSSDLSSTPYKGYESEFYLVDGQQLTPSDFGEYDDNGVWRPKPYTGTYGTNGFYLTFDSTAINGIGHDHSGNGNNFTPSGFAATDVVLDTPTNNFATYNHLSRSNFATIALSEGNLKSVNSSNHAHASSLGTIFVNSGKWYCEFRSNAAGDEDAIGIFTEQFNTSVYSFYNGNFIALLGGNLYYSTYRIYAGSDFGSGDIVRMKLDLDNQTVGWAINGGSFNDVDITSFDSHSAGEYWTFGVRNGSSGGDGTHNISVNFGQDSSFAGAETRQNNSDDNGKGDFYYDPPTGFLALCTANLPAPSIKDGSKYFQTVLWTGDNTDDRSITVADNSSNSWQPDWVWYKRRNVSASHLLFDAVRGATKCLRSDTTNVENTESNALQAFESTGFQVGSDSNSNSSSYNFVSWNWLASNGTTSNTDGSITSTVSANPDAGFSIVGYTGNGSSSATVGHGLGVIPSLVIAKSRNTAEAWMVKHKDLASNNVLELAVANATADATTFSNGSIGNLTSSTTFGFVSGSSGVDSVNKSGDPVIAYCFAEVENYSRIGSYTGNGSQDGPFVYCGFKPAWIMVKVLDESSSWAILDNARDPYNVVDAQLWADLPNEENTSYERADFLSNGFKVRPSDTNPASFNKSGNTYVFVAFAEHPFGGIGVSPATAR